jgi:undecaprenyl-diphosphatase
MLALTLAYPAPMSGRAQLLNQVDMPKLPPNFPTIPILLVIVTATWGVLELHRFSIRITDANLDQRILQGLRDSSDAARMIGPAWLAEAMRDFTALGGYAVLITSTVVFAAFTRMELGRGPFRFFLGTIVGGFISGIIVKELIQRPRPTVVPHLSLVTGNTSFPSSHAMMSVVVFVTAGLLLSELTRQRVVQLLLLGCPLGLAFLVGISRVCMGVHFPSDVLGGWSAGLAWVWLSFSLRLLLQRRSVLHQEADCGID